MLWLSQNIIDLFILTLLEIVLGIDNILFLSIVIQKVENKLLARYIGLSLALIIRVIMIIYLQRLLEIDLTLLDIPIKNLTLTLGGLFLICKSGQEIYEDLSMKTKQLEKKRFTHFAYVILQISLIDLIFSLDSVLSAIAITNNIIVIVIAFIAAMIAIIKISSHSVNLLNTYPRLKTLSLVFLMVVGVSLIAEGFNIHIAHKYLYIAFVFSLIVELLNISLERIDKNEHDT